MARPLAVRPLTRKAFAPYGEVIDTDGAPPILINAGTTKRFHALAAADVGAEGGVAILSIFRGEPRSLPYEVTMMERHPLGSQAFYPLDGRPWLVIVADDEDGRPGRPLAFNATGRQGVQYRRNVWHHPLMALGARSEFLIVDRDGPGDNLEERGYRDPYRIDRIG